MNFESLAKQGREKLHTGLAGVNAEHLIKIRKQTLRNCFAPFDQNANRLEFLARIQGVEFLNDAASQTPNSTWFSLESVNKAIHWIAYSDNGQTDFTSLIPMALEKVKSIIYVGEDSTQYLQRVFTGIIPTILHVSSLEQAVSKAFYLASENETVLFSPACKTQKSAEDSGIEFRQVVHAI